MIVCALIEQLHRRLLVDVADEPAVHAIANEFLQTRGERAHERRRDPELLVLLLTDVAGAVVHGDADAPLAGAVGTAAVPQAAMPDQHAAARHRGRDAVVVLAVVW